MGGSSPVLGGAAGAAIRHLLARRLRLGLVQDVLGSAAHGATKVEPGAHTHAGHHALRCGFCHTFIPRLTVGDVLPDLFLCRLRQFFQHAFGEGTTSDLPCTTGQATRYGASTRGNAVAPRTCSQGGLEVFHAGGWLPTGHSPIPPVTAPAAREVPAARRGSMS